MKELVSEGIRLNIKSLQNEKTRYSHLEIDDSFSDPCLEGSHH